MRIYLASRWANREKLWPIRNRLENNGHFVTSRWLSSESDDKEEQALMDLTDIGRADALVLFPDDLEISSGGRYFEFGYAYAKGKKCYVVYPETTSPKSIFIELSSVTKCKDWDALLTKLHESDVEQEYYA